MRGRHGPATALKRGQMVVWRNRDGAQHTVVAGRSGTALGSGRLARGDRYDYTALDAGVVGYACRIHGWMRGVLRVADG